ncbi:MAG TPA: ABC transporter substrate-binding protein [Acidimicrobiales bacterium]|nr:ABC transporter substrate-binding protein [Acidimicrobiales bacterium]
MSRSEKSQGFAGRRLSRRLSGRRPGLRAAVAGAVAVGLFVPLAVGAGGTGAGAASSNVNPNGILKYGFDLNNEFAGTFDPEKEQNDCGYTIYQNLYQSLTAPGQTAITGGVAQSWTVSNNSSTITFHLRPNLVFSNGDPVTATAVAESLNYIKKSPLRSSLSAIAGTQVVNPTTLVVTLNRPTAGDFLWAATYIDGSVMDPSTIGNGVANLHPVGAGPFMLKSYSPGGSVELVKNPKYWDPSAYPLGGVNFIEVAAGPPSVTALTSGAVDMIQLEPEDYKTVKNNPNIAVTTTHSYDYMILQMRENTGPFANAKVRAALEYAVNRPAINDVVFSGLGQPAYQPFPSSSPGYNKAIGNSYSYNPQKSKAMLKAAGFPSGVTFKFIVPGGDATFDRAAQILQASMAPAGFHANIQQVPGGDIFTDVYINKLGDALLSDDLTNGPDITNNFESEYETTGFGAQQLGSVNPTVANVTLKANASLSPSVQGPLAQQAVKTIMSQGLEVPIEFIPSIIAYNKNVVGGHVVAPIGNCRSNLAGIYIKK